MKKQETFTDIEYSFRKKKTKREEFLEIMDEIIPWDEWVGVIMMKGGTIVDATIINAPCSTKNTEKARDPEMHQTKKGNEWKFGMKCHIGVDAGSGLVHTMTVTAANEHDITQTANLLREDEGVV